MGMEKYATEMVKAVGNCTVIELYNLLQVGEYIWKWSLGYRMPHTSSEFGASQDLQLVYARAAMVEEKR